MTSHMQDLPPFVDPTTTALAAYQAASKQERVRYPDGFPRTSNVRVLRAERRPVLRHSELSTHFKGFEEANSLGTLSNNLKEFEAFIRAEQQELVAAFKRRPRVDDMLTERRVAITILSHNHSEGDFNLLDAAAYIAHTPDVRDRRATHDARMFYLAGDAATKYVRAHRIPKEANLESASIMGKGTKGLREVCISWVDQVNEEGAHRIVSSFAEIEYQSDPVDPKLDEPRPTAADNYVDAIRRAITKAANTGGCNVDLGRCLGYYSKHDVNNAYQRCCVQSAENFFGFLYGKAVSNLSDYCKSDVNFNGQLEVSDTWVRLIPKGSELASTICTSGRLLHQLTYSDQMVQFCSDVQSEERQKNPSNPLYGLRCLKPDEVPIAPHILYIDAKPTTMCNSVTAYSLAQKVPGASLHRGTPMRPDAGWGTLVYCIQRYLVALDSNFIKHFFVCPCSERACAFLHRQEFAIYSAIFFETTNMCQTTCFKSILQSSFQMSKAKEATSSASEAEADDNEAECSTQNKRKRQEPTPQEQALLKALRFDLMHPALSLGEAHSEMTRLLGPEEFSQLLVAMSEYTSLDASILEGCSAATKALRSFETYKKQSKQKIEELQLAVDTASSARSTSSTESLDTLATCGAEPKAPAEEKLSQGGMHLLRKTLGLGMTTDLDISGVLTWQMAVSMCKRIASMLEVKLKVTLSDEDLNGLYTRIAGLKRLPTMRVLTVISTYMLKCTDKYDSVVVFLASANGILLYVTKPDGQAEQLSPTALLNSNVARTGFMIFDEPAMKLYTLKKRESG